MEQRRQRQWREAEEEQGEIDVEGRRHHRHQCERISIHVVSSCYIYDNVIHVQKNKETKAAAAAQVLYAHCDC